MGNILASRIVSSLGALTGGIAVTCTISHSAIAQDISGIDDGAIIVTAQKRAERVNLVPLSLSVSQGDDMLRSDARSVADISKLTPNLSIDPVVNLSGSNAAASFYIRGVGQSDFLLTTDPGVGLYIDGVYVARSVGSLLNMLDIERVEVLRGPQGTLYGKNTIGGAINVVTRKPEADFAATLDLTVGDDRRFDAIGTLNMPITEGVRSRVTVARFGQRGYVKRPLAGDRLSNVDRYAVRGQIAIDVAPDFDLLLAGDYMDADENGGASTLLATYSSAGPPPNQTFVHNVVLGAPDGVYDNRWLSGSKFVANGTGPSRSRLRLGGVSATATVGFGAVELRSITAWRGFKTHFLRDGDLSPLSIYSNESTVVDRELTKEIQLSSAQNSALSWLVGGFYGRETGRDDSKLFLAGFDIQSGASAIKNEGWALFGQATVRPIPALGLTAGLRYTDESKSYTPDQYIIRSRLPMPPTGLVLVPSGTARESYNNVSYRLAADYRFSNEVMTYLAWSTGFKGGGFTQRNSSPRTSLPTFEPETSKVVEAGAKYQSADGRLRISGAAFHTRYDDLQILVVEQAGFAPLVRNAAKAKIDGFELEAEVRLRFGPRVKMHLGHLDARYTDIDARASEIQLKSHLVRTPQWTGGADVSMDIAFDDVGTFTPRMGWNYTSAVWLDALNSPELHQSSYHLLDAGLSFQPVRWDALLSLGVHNLTNKHYLVSGNVNRSLGAATGSFARPRQVYLRVRFTL